MAEYYTQFSCLLDVGSAQNAAQALELYTVFCAEGAEEDPTSEYPSCASTIFGP